ncbi:nuclear transport factor 2 family protein [Massilia sp. CFBP9012]|uniref:nuclear transport factor 2 family protein n=1 Tax=Massilia sp. CFBP9012 TaxID=3096531 RepID=UPI002A6AD622|nr:nuclear transport factor 2 family protein [Massilia sp. CFBP9012]MDY0975849.1 nuclear transport factor 2 family protein [Massilia sp. CFBP9012]
MEFSRSGSGAALRWMAAWVLMAALAWFASPARADSGAAQAQSNKEAVSKAFAAWAAGGRTFFDDMLAPNVVWTIKGSSPTARVLRGKQELIDGAVTPLSTRLQRQIRPTIRNLWADGDHVIIEWDGEAVAKDGKPYRNSYLWIFRMQGGRATEVTAYLDLAPYDDVLRRVPASQ